MINREDYLTIIRIALLDFGFDVMMHVVMFVIAWDVLIHVILKEDEEEDDVMFTDIRCANCKRVIKEENKNENKAVNKVPEKDGMIGRLPGESQGERQGESKVDSNDENKVDLQIEADVKGQEVPKEEHDQELEDADKAVVGVEEDSNCIKQETISLKDRVDMSFGESIRRIRYSGRVMINGVKYYSECKTSIIWSCYVVEETVVELLRIRYDKKRKSMTSTITKGMIYELTEVATFDKKDLVEILAIMKRFCKIKRY